jgi:hypothetical protein
MGIKFDDLKTGNNLAFFGSYDDNGPWVRIGRAIKSAENTFTCEVPIEGYRYVKMESEEPITENFGIKIEVAP